MTDSTVKLSGASISEPEEQDHTLRIGDIAKRSFDIAVAALGMIFLFPLMVYLIFRIRRDSPGPAFYRGLRMGKDGQVFKIMKFRTMFEDPISYSGPKVTGKDDSRITPLGRWLRDTKVNEFPQLWNVFVGEMSLVGPRPEDPDIANQWPEDLRKEILSVRPGITSPASVIYRDEESLLKGSLLMDTYLGEILPSKLRLDQLYVRYRNFWSDIDILFWTFLLLFPLVRSYSPPEDSFFLGPLTRLMRRHVNWFFADTFICLMAMAAAGLLFRSFGPLDVGQELALLLALAFAILFSLVNMALGVNRIQWSRAGAIDVFDLLPGTIIAGSLAVMINTYYPQALIRLFYGSPLPDYVARPLLPNGLIVVAALLAFVGFVTLRFRSRLFTGIASRWLNLRGTADPARERVLIVGGGDTGRLAAWMINDGRYSQVYRVVGFVDDDLYKRDIRIAGVRVLGTRHQITDLVKAHDIGMIIFAIHNISAEERKHLINICSHTSAQVVIFPDIPVSLGSLRIRSSGPDDIDIIDGLASLDTVDRWLANLELSGETGDKQMLLQNIGDLRRQLRQFKHRPYPTKADRVRQGSASSAAVNTENNPE